MPFDREAAKAAGYTDAEIDSYLQSQSPPPQRSAGDEIIRQLGLTARAGVQGAMALPSLLAEAPRQLLNLIPGVDFPPQGQLISELLTSSGLPTPETQLERLAGAGAEALTGGGGIIKAGQAISGSLPTLSKVLTAEPGIQAATAISGGLASQGVAEAGGGPIAQLAAGLVAGLATGSTAMLFRPSPAKERITQLIQEGVPEAETAGFQVVKPEKLEKVKISLASQKGGITNYLRPTQQVERVIRTGAPKLVKDKVAQETLRQGFDPGVIAAVKGASKADRRLMLRMVDIMEKGKKNSLFAMDNRPTDIIGSSLMSRFKVIRDTNQRAGKLLDKVAGSLKGKRIDSGKETEGFFTELEKMGIVRKNTDDGLQLDFNNSDIAGLDGPQRVINHVFNRLNAIDATDAHNLHRLKKFIDEHVTFGKSMEGLSGKAELLLKGFRRNIDGLLDRTFPKYDKVNKIYADTVNTLDEFQNIAGRQIDLTGPLADKAAGQLMRGIMSNNKSRVRLLDSVNDIERTAVKYGGKFDDNLMIQSLFADELDSMFSPVARTSFQGQISQAVERTGRAVTSPREEALGVAAKTLEKARGINQENAFFSIKELLRRGQ